MSRGQLGYERSFPMPTSPFCFIDICFTTSRICGLSTSERADGMQLNKKKSLPRSCLFRGDKTDVFIIEDDNIIRSLENIRYSFLDARFTVIHLQELQQDINVIRRTFLDGVLLVNLLQLLQEFIWLVICVAFDSQDIVEQSDQFLADNFPAVRQLRRDQEGYNLSPTFIQRFPFELLVAFTAEGMTISADIRVCSLI